MAKFNVEELIEELQTVLREDGNLLVELVIEDIRTSNFVLDTSNGKNCLLCNPLPHLIQKRQADG